MLKKILSVGGWTLVSRLTGFIRDVILAAVMGAGPVADAFLVAFRIPNHFRAIFSEGAFNSAFLPTYAQVLETDGESQRALFREPRHDADADRADRTSGSRARGDAGCRHPAGAGLSQPIRRSSTSR